MPLYPYRCTQCGHKFEKIQSFSAAPETECPKCEGLLERTLTAPGLQFKGAGWYVNDYAPKSGGSTSETAKSDSKADSKTESKTESKSDSKTESKASSGEGASAAPAAAAPAASS